MSSITATIQSPGAVINVTLDQDTLVKEELQRRNIPTDNVVINGVPAAEGATFSQGDQVTALPTKRVSGNA